MDPSSPIAKYMLRCMYTSLIVYVTTVFRAAPPRSGLWSISVSRFVSHSARDHLMARLNRPAKPAGRPTSQPRETARGWEWGIPYAHPDGVTTPNAQSAPSFWTTWLSKTGVMTTPALASETQRARIAVNFIFAVENCARVGGIVVIGSRPACFGINCTAMRNRMSDDELKNCKEDYDAREVKTIEKKV